MGTSKRSTNLNTSVTPQPLTSFPKCCLHQVKCLGAESTAHSTFIPSDAACEGLGSGVPALQWPLLWKGLEWLVKKQQKPKYLLCPSPPCQHVPYIQTQSLPPGMSPPLHPGMTTYPPPCAPPATPTSFDLTRHCQQRAPTPKPSLIHAYNH